MNKKNLVARLTMTKRSGIQLVVEVHVDAGWSTFYHWYEVDGKVKRFIRNSDRNNGCNPELETPGLEQVAEQVIRNFDKLAAHPVTKHAMLWRMHQIVDTQVRIYKKRLYKRLITCSPDQLPGGIVRLPDRNWTNAIQPASEIRIMDEYRKMKERRSKLFGWKKEEKADKVPA
jgi:hypothetical protein